MLELLIIGAGPTGLYAGFLAGLRKIKTAIIESANETGGQLAAVYKDKYIYDIPGFSKIKAKDFIYESMKQFSRFKDEIPILYDNEAIDIVKDNDHFIVTTNHQAISTKTILITHGGGGFVPQKLKAATKEYKNLHYYVDDPKSYSGQNVLVLGGGDSALDWALELSDYAKVTLVHRRNEFRAQKLSVDEFAHKGVILTPYTVKSVNGDEFIKDVVIENLQNKEELTLNVDSVIVNYGFVLAKSRLKEWNVDEDQGLIKVRSNMQTSLEGIFAAGNGVTYDGKVKLISTGFGEASIAINSITNLLYPNRALNTIHSSNLIEE